MTSYSGGIVAQTAPDLTKAINRENDRLIKANTKELPKYDYPMNVITAAMMQRYARYGVDLKIRADDCIQVGNLDAQKQDGKSIFGSGLLLCERAAAVRWELSDREESHHTAAWLVPCGGRRHQQIVHAMHDHLL